MIRLNLLPDIKREYIKARRSEAKAISFSLLLSMIAIGGMLLFGAYVYGVQTLQVALLTGDIKKNMQQLKETKDVEKYVTLQNQLNNLTALHEGKNTYSRFFDMLKVLNPPAPNNMEMASTSIDSVASTLTFEGTANSYTALITFRDTLVHANVSYYVGDDDKNLLSENLFSNVNIDEQGLSKGLNGEPKVSFKISTTYLAKAFSASSTQVNVTVPALDTTPSRQGMPTNEPQTTPTGGAQ